MTFIYDDEPVELCSYEIYAGERYGDAPTPPEFCENEVVPGEEYCAQHLQMLDDVEPWDDDRYYLVDDYEPLEES